MAMGESHTCALLQLPPLLLLLAPALAPRGERRCKTPWSTIECDE